MGSDSAHRAGAASQGRGREAGWALILDMDGVIVDSEPIHKKADVAVFRSVGLDIPVPVLQEYAGFGGDVFFRSILERFGRAGDPQALRREKNRILASLLREDTPPVPGILGLLDRAGAAGIPLAVASSSDAAIVGLVLDRLAIRRRFAAVVDGSQASRGKPAPDLFLVAARALGMPPSRCAVVEDSAAGTRAARAAGMYCIGLRNPNSGDQDLSAADRVVASPDEIELERIPPLLERAQ